MKNYLILFMMAVSTSLFVSTQSFGQASAHQLSSHILDVSKGQPASDVTIRLERLNPQSKQWVRVDEKATDRNGRISDFLPAKAENGGTYKLTFLVDEYFRKNGVASFYPFIEVVFEIKGSDHYHIPITLSPYGYSTYRGS
ncbi:hydroxyisourate hydrolase [Rudanella paleaurantiibacter]|uniref:5-hydroxyisourate hydrolase n=1 Tax=Rudanella paleaurantiibacter TaxID=2614655 RepID=A0A7J5TU03_9BACT|nr:hydroxyisourate hydrolase [Rudanella paleaurantiibacter]KAB7727384.1 hydroxyisourate hydrolase [Rudanella paleaurantiibacter]